jgi:signal transduction histidine kinase
VREKERDRVFQPFVRARQPQIISEFGYGLNLYLCKHEVEAMNGKMWFESDETAGTTFTVMLPAWSAQPNSRSSDSDQSSEQP